MNATSQPGMGWPGEFSVRWLKAAARQLVMDAEEAGPWSPHRHHRAHARPGGFPGPPFGWPGFAGPPRGGRGRRSRRGDVRLAVLTLLAEQPMHGYQVITELVNRSGGAWQPSPGSIYPTLQQLEDEGLVTVAESDGRRTFSLTEAGRAELQRATAGRRPPWEEMAEDADDATGRLRERAGQVMAAVAQVAAGGDDEQMQRADKLLRDCRRSLYRLLAEDDAEDQP